MVEEVSTEKFASVVARVLDDRLAKNIVILDISKVSSLADFFVIASGDSPTQVKAMTETLQDRIKTLFKLLPKGVERDMKNRWNLIFLEENQNAKGFTFMMYILEKILMIVLELR